MKQVNIHEAKTKLSRLIAAVEQGEEIVIARYGVPVARLVPIRPTTPPRKPGTARGKFEIPESFFEPLPDDILEAFEK
jgi:prevent-host-death family protein